MSGLNKALFSEDRAYLQKALPKEAPLAMPRHTVHEKGVKLRTTSSLFHALRTGLSRGLVFVVTAALSGYGVAEMYGVLRTNSVTLLQWVFLVLFSVNFIWVAFAFSQALAGFFRCVSPWRARLPEWQGDLPFTTAVLLPVYKEDPRRIAAAVRAMRHEILAQAPGKYAFFILSDTNEANAWIAEESVFSGLVDHDTAGCPVYYRRRSKNTERKAGNIADWVSRWGADYEAMIVLDADSIMSASTLLTLSRRLAAAPGVGLIQTLPKIVRASSLYGRLQQFANHCFGPVYGHGLSAWHGVSSNFWGHNAIIRTSAFAQSCSLPVLSGKPPFGGHILSHDFIEAGLLRRAGWGVRFDADIEGSFEEAPPSLVDVLVRDRRWCQGNLQHGRLLFARGLSWPTRIHLFSGMMSYLSAVFWLSLIVVGLSIAVQTLLVRPEYFVGMSLFPTWPVFDSERALNLFMVSTAVVLAPKVFGWFAALVNWRRCRQFGGPVLLTLSTLTETLFSALYAPILMVAQFGVVCSILMGKDSGWNPQSRDDGALKWSTACRAHLGHTLFGACLAAIAWWHSIQLFFWLLPITGGLMLSIPLSWLSGGTKRAKPFAIFGLFRVPEEQNPRAILRAVSMESETAVPCASSLPELACNDQLLAWHMTQLPERDVAEFHGPTVTAEWKIRHANSIEQLESWLEPDERLALLGNVDCIHLLSSKPLTA